MNLQAKKLELVQLILNTEKPSVLAKVEAIFRMERGTDWWDNLSAAEKKAIEAGIDEADNGKLIPHEKVREEIKTKYKID